MKGRRILKRIGAGCAGVVLLWLLGWIGLHFMPLPRGLFQPPQPELELLDRQGVVLRSIGYEGGQFSRPVNYHELPQSFVEATLAAEDKRFWKHHGMDWQANVRAGISLVRHRRIFSGASTITQQLIKRAQPRARRFLPKLKEAAQALRLEQVWDKQRIFSEYVNRVEYGNRCLGCAEAADFYFGKKLRELSVAEAAFLAGLPQAPTRLNPHKNFAQARERQIWVLQRMRLNGWLPEAEYKRAIDETVRLRPPVRRFEAPHFIDLLLSELGEGLDSGTRVKTTLDLELNRLVAEKLRERLALLEGHHVQNGAVVVIENASGDVWALVGSEDYFAPDAGQVNGAWTGRSAGSTFKPFTYLLALQRGHTPASVVADVPVEFPTSTGVFAPVNYNRRCYGPMRYRLALANSLNIAAVKVLDEIGGTEVLQQRLQACGLTTLNRPAEAYGLGLTIGNAEARLLELANAYACLARLGSYKPFKLVLNSSGSMTKARPVCDPDACYLVADILSDNAARTMAFGPESPLRFEFPVACKTGTSSDFRDNWAFGYTPEFTVGVWVGNFDGSPMDQVSGVTGAAPIMHEVMQHLHARYGTTWYAPRTNIVERMIHPITGKHLSTNQGRCRVEGVREKFLARSLPPEEGTADYDAECRVILGREYAEWFATGDNWLGGRGVVGQGAPELRLRSPLPGSVYYLDPDLPEQAQWLTLKADGPPGLVWRCETLNFEVQGDRTVAKLTSGKHQITVESPATGERRETWILVKQL